MNKISRNILLQDLKKLYQDVENYVFVMEYKSVLDETLSNFRATLKKDTGLKAVALKNKINLKAISGTSFSSMEVLFIGQNLFIFTKDPIKTCSVIKKFTGSEGLLKFKTLFFNKKMYGIDYVNQLSSVSDIDGLRAKFLGVVSSVMSSFLYILSEKKELSGKSDNSGES